MGGVWGAGQVELEGEEGGREGVRDTPAPLLPICRIVPSSGLGAPDHNCSDVTLPSPQQSALPRQGDTPAHCGIHWVTVGACWGREWIRSLLVITLPHAFLDL